MSICAERAGRSGCLVALTYDVKARGIDDSFGFSWMEVRGIVKTPRNAESEAESRTHEQVSRNVMGEMV